MFGFPFFKCYCHPEAVNSAGDDAQKKPFDPVAEELHGGSRKTESAAVDNGVFGFPVVNHAAGPGITDTQGDCCDKGSQQMPAYKLKETAVEVRFLCCHTFVSFLVFAVVI